MTPQPADISASHPDSLPATRHPAPHLEALGDGHLGADAQSQLRDHPQTPNRHAQGAEEVGVGGGGDRQLRAVCGDEREADDLCRVVWVREESRRAGEAAPQVTTLGWLPNNSSPGNLFRPHQSTPMLPKAPPGSSASRT